MASTRVACFCALSRLRPFDRALHRDLHQDRDGDDDRDEDRRNDRHFSRHHPDDDQEDEDEGQIDDRRQCRRSEEIAQRFTGLDVAGKGAGRLRPCRHADREHLLEEC